MSPVRTNSGARLNREWSVGASHALYHKDGNFFMPLERFPGAYLDTNGYILFKSEEDYKNNSYLSGENRVHVRGNISQLLGYIKMK